MRLQKLPRTTPGNIRNQALFPLAKRPPCASEVFAFAKKELTARTNVYAPSGSVPCKKLASGWWRVELPSSAVDVRREQH